MRCAVRTQVVMCSTRLQWKSTHSTVSTSKLTMMRPPTVGGFITMMVAVRTVAGLQLNGVHRRVYIIAIIFCTQVVSTPQNTGMPPSPRYFWVIFFEDESLIGEGSDLWKKRGDSISASVFHRLVEEVLCMKDHVLNFPLIRTGWVNLACSW